MLAVPLPEVWTGGTCSAPVSGTVNETGAACAKVIDPAHARPTNTMRARRVIEIVILFFPIRYVLAEQWPSAVASRRLEHSKKPTLPPFQHAANMTTAPL